MDLSIQSDDVFFKPAPHLGGQFMLSQHVLPQIKCRLQVVDPLFNLQSRHDGTGIVSWG